MVDPKTYLFELPEKANQDALEGHNTVFHFDIAESGQYSVVVAEGIMTVHEGFHAEAVCKVTTDADSFSKLISKDLNPMMAFMMGKIKLSNPGEMIKYAKIFGLM